MITEIWQALSDPWASAIMQRALLDIMLLAVTAGSLGCWVVLYGLSYNTESMAHALFPGLVAAALIGFPTLVGGLVGLVAAASAIAAATRIRGIDRDTSVAIVVTTMFAVGVLLALSSDSPPGLQQLLFGDVLGVSDLDLMLAAVLAVAVVLALHLLRPSILATGFDRSVASALGARPVLIETILLVLLALAIVVAIQALGNLLVVALFVGPAASAWLLTRRIATMMLVATSLATLAGVAGLYLSYHARTATGASIALAIAAIFIIALLADAFNGRVRARRSTLRLASAPPATPPVRS
jgi:ABC-type Mn2+/Zn2+ transport system permease subunit